MKNKILIALFLLNSIVGFAQSHSGKIVGEVKSSDGEPLSYAFVFLKDENKSTMTEDNGSFQMSVPAGKYTLVISYNSHISKEQAVIVKVNETANVGTIVLDVKTNTLDEVVVSGMISKFAKKQSEDVARMPLKNLENPQVYTVIPKELLVEQVSVDFKSALSTSPGISNVTLGVGSGGTGLAMHMRGFTGANGAGAIRNGMATNFVSLSDPANLESLEVIKGPSSTLFGTTLVSYGGLVNRVTKKPKVAQSGEVALSAGSSGLGRASVDFNTPLNEEKNMLFRINSAFQQEGSFQDYGVNRTYMIAPSFTYHVNDRLILNLDLEYFNSDRSTSYINITPASGIKNVDELNWDFKKSYISNDITSSAKVFNAFAKATYQLSDVWVSNTQYSYSNTINDANYIFLDVNKTDSLTRRIMNIPSTFNTNQIQQNFIGDFRIGSVRNRLLLGLDYTQLTTNDTRASVNYDKVEINGKNVNIDEFKYQNKLSTASRSQYNRHTNTYSAYASDVVTAFDRLDIMLSLRIDYFEDQIAEYNQTSLSPKFGLVYQVLKDRISIFGNYMDGFKNVAPGFTEESPDEKTAFKPEHATQLEGGLKFEFLNGKISSTLSYYDIKVRDKLRSVTGTDGKRYSVQDGTQESKGFEADLIANPIQGMHIILGYGYNDSKFTKADPSIDGKRPYATPKHVANFWVSQKLVHGTLKGLGFGLGGNFASEQYHNDINTIVVPGYGKLDATVFYEQPKFRIGLKLNNITNKEYWLTDYYAEVGALRSFIANVTYKF